MKNNKLILWIVVILFCSCSAIQDAMPGMSYSDRTLIKGIYQCSEISIQKSFTHLKSSNDKYSDVLFTKIDNENKSLTRTLKRLGKLREFRNVLLGIDDEVSLFFSREQKNFELMVKNCKYPSEPEELMMGGYDAISRYFSEEINWRKKIIKIISEDQNFKKLSKDFNDLIDLYNEIPYLDEKVSYCLFDLVSFEMFKKLYEQISANEYIIRTNPQIRTAPILKKTFGDYDSV